MAFLLPLMQIRDGDLIFLVAQRGIGLPQHHNLTGTGVGQGTQQDRVHHAEDGGVGSDAQGQRDDGNNRERRTAAQHAEPVADVLADGFHQNDSSNIASPFFELLNPAEGTHRLRPCRVG
ncbi:MAG: hypothetical protein ACKVHE_29735 [Planctomycetales bacterium]